MTKETEEEAKTEPMQRKSQIANLENVSFSSPDRLLFFGVNLSIKQGENIALIGDSGVGKTTLLRIVLGQEAPDTGTAMLKKDIKVSYVPQDIEDLDVEEDITIHDLFYRARGLADIEGRKAELETMMGAPENADRMQQIFDEYTEVSERFEQMGGYTADVEIDTILAGLKLDEETTGHITQNTRLNEVSSGQRTRALIGQALFANADLLVLDDPTSHLDVESVEWLGNYLRRSNQASLTATNNVPFIDTNANKVIEITDFGRVLSFEGNYQDYMTKRDRLLEAEKAEAEAVKAEKERLEATYLKFKGEGVFKRSQSMAQTGRAMESRMRRLDQTYDALPGSRQVDRVERVRNLIFTPERRSGEVVVQIDGLVKRYGDFTALDLHDLALSIMRGQKILFSGENGSGKSTLLRMIASVATNGTFLPDEGTIGIGANVLAGYYAPDHTGISRKGSIFEEIKKATNHHNEGEAAATLNFWGFPRGSVRVKKIENLSVGERKQLSLARLMVQHPNLLLLDEPTDYLRPEIIERLVHAINGFDGTVVLISHNPEFKRQLRLTKELTLPEGKIILLDKTT